jgi:hypothetical protein
MIVPVIDQSGATRHTGGVYNLLPATGELAYLGAPPAA